MSSDYLIIDKIVINGYKALKNVNLNLRAMNIIVGENATGKTSILEFIFDIIQGYILPNFKNGSILTVDLEFPKILAEISFKGKLFVIDEFSKPRIPKADIYGSYVIDPVFSFLYQDDEATGKFKFKDQKLQFYIKDWTGQQNYLSTYQLADVYGVSITKKIDWFLLRTNALRADTLAKEMYPFDEYFRNALSKFISENIPDIRQHSYTGNLQEEPLGYRPGLGFQYQNLSFHIKFKHIKPINLIFIQAHREILARPPKLSESIPKNWQARRNSDALLSYLYYISNPEFKHQQNKILDWANKFGLKAMNSWLIEQYKIKTQYRNEAFDKEINVAEAGLGTGQLLYIIVECVLAEKGTLILIDEV